jgi:hypothetical protein
MEDKDAQFIAKKLQETIELMFQLQGGLASLGHGLAALKLVLANQISPGDPVEGLKQIQLIESEMAKRDPQAKARDLTADVIEATKLMQKHGGAKQS